jgi:hypothetical protein
MARSLEEGPWAIWGPLPSAYPRRARGRPQVGIAPRQRSRCSPSGDICRRRVKGQRVGWCRCATGISTVSRLLNWTISRRGATLLRRRNIAPPECRIRIPVTTTSGTLCTHPENTAPIPTMAMTITGSSKNGASDTDGRCDGRT